jgi:hypothetical protein
MKNFKKGLDILYKYDPNLEVYPEHHEMAVFAPDNVSIEDKKKLEDFGWILRNTGDFEENPMWIFPR